MLIIQKLQNILVVKSVQKQIKCVPLQSDYYRGELRAPRCGVLIVVLLARHDG